MQNNGSREQAKWLAALRCKAMLWAIVPLLTFPTQCLFGEEPADQAGNIDPAQLSRAFRTAAEKVLPSCVTIETMSGPRKTMQWAMHERRVVTQRREPEGDASEDCPQCSVVGYARDGTGSGIVIDRRGFIITCSHVVDDADAVFVRLPNGRRLPAAHVWRDDFTDLAVIHVVPVEELKEVRFGDSSKLAIGDWVVSIGNPYGLGTSISSGIISAVDRQLVDTPWTPLIQSDAASNPGNSGGALVNLRGEVIGISEGSYGASRGFQGISLAIPINAADRIARQLIEHGEIRRAILGCHMETVSPEIARQLGLQNSEGVVICDVTSPSPAANAGIQLGDVITGFTDVPIHDKSHLLQMLETAKADEPFRIQLYRDGKTLLTTISLSRPPKEQNPLEIPPPPEPIHQAKYTDRLLGMMLDDLSIETAAELGFGKNSQGVLITHVLPEFAAHKEGLCAGMLILKVGNYATPNLDAFKDAMTRQTLEKGILLLVISSDQKHFMVLRR